MYNYSAFTFQGIAPHFIVKQEPGMKKNMVTFLACISMAALLAGGCANSGAVKKEEAIVPAADNGDAARAAAERAAAEKAAADRAAAEKAAADRAAAERAAANAKEAQEAPEKMARANAASASKNAEIKFETVYFDFDKSDLRQDARDTLSKNAETILKSMADAKIQIEGHCDERGSAEYNLALGERRAKSVQKYLTTLSVKADNLSTISYGKEKPAVNGSDEAAWAKNRRAEFVVAK